MKLNSFIGTSALVGVTALALTAGPTAQASDAIADFYKGKTIRVIVGSGPGGGYDTYARLIARHLGKLIPGNPKFLVQNKDGAGSIIAMNYVQNKMKKDGTAIGAIQRNVALVQIMGQPGPQFEAAKLNWLGSLANEAGACGIATRTGIKSFDDVFKKEFIMGGTGPNDTEFVPALMNNLLGAKFKLIRGYPSTPPVHLAIERGEVDGVCQSWSSLYDQGGRLIDSGAMKPVIQLSLKSSAAMDKRGIPMIWDYVNAKRVTKGFSVDDVKSYFHLVFAAKAMGRPFTMAAGVPAERVKAMRAAFTKMASDPAFLADAKKQRRVVDLVTGDEIQTIVENMAKTPKNMLNNLDALMKFKGKTAMVKLKMLKHTGKVVETKNGNRSIVINYKGKKVLAKISGSRTKTTLGGKKVKRKAFKVGMTCTFVYLKPGSEAKEVSCKK
jgi:tripartite-type tricarboxylate transporter receptor subunit TctC